MKPYNLQLKVVVTISNRLDNMMGDIYHRSNVYHLTRCCFILLAVVTTAADANGDDPEEYADTFFVKPGAGKLSVQAELVC